MAQEFATVLSSRRPDLKFRVGPQPGPQWTQKAGDALRIALVVWIAFLLLDSVGLNPAPSVLTSLARAYAGPSLIVLMIGNQIVGASSATGAFEVVNERTGLKVFSMLESGRMPTVPELLQRLPPPSRHTGVDRSDADELDDEDDSAGCRS